MQVSGQWAAASPCALPRPAWAFSSSLLISIMPKEGSLKRKGRAMRSLDSTMEARANSTEGLTPEGGQCLRDRLASSTSPSPRGSAGIITLPSAVQHVPRAGGAVLGEGFLKLTFNFPLLRIYLKPSHSGL